MILTSAQIKKADSLYLSENNITEYELVKNAAAGAYAVLKKQFGSFDKKRVLMLCGGGLNGADGFALALLLSCGGADVTICRMYDSKPQKTAYELCCECEKNGIGISDGIADDFDYIIDAVFGIGFHGELENSVKDIFERLSGNGALKIALDVPSGVFADSAAAASGAFQADLTVALCAKKPCHLLFPAKKLCGKTLVADIGFPDDIAERAGAHLFELKKHDFKMLVERRCDSLHKGLFGKAGLVVGSLPYRGAAVLSVKAALKCGAGIVSAYIPDSIYDAFSANCMSAVIHPLKSKNGCISDRELTQKLSGCTAVLCGSGLGLCEGSEAAVRAAARSDLPAVFDGDALTVIAHDLSIIDRRGETVLTPHVGEFSRLCKRSVDDIGLNRIPLALQFASEHKCVLVLKDSVSIIAQPNGRAFVLSEPTSALSKGGSGDVLAGMLCSFLAQGYSAAAAAAIAVSLHNCCGHAACERFGSFSTLPEDVIDMIPLFLK